MSNYYLIFDQYVYWSNLVLTVNNLKFYSTEIKKKLRFRCYKL